MKVKDFNIKTTNSLEITTFKEHEMYVDINSTGNIWGTSWIYTQGRFNEAREAYLSYQHVNLRSLRRHTHDFAKTDLFPTFQTFFIYVLDKINEDRERKEIERERERERETTLNRIKQKRDASKLWLPNYPTW